MKTSDYSNREIDQMMASIHEKLDQILLQTTKTNGRVSKLEKWKWTITGGAIALGAINIPNVLAITKLIALQ